MRKRDVHGQGGDRQCEESENQQGVAGLPAPPEMLRNQQMRVRNMQQGTIGRARSVKEHSKQAMPG